MKKDYKISFVLGKEFFDDYSKKSTIILNCKSKKHAKRKWKKLLKKYRFDVTEYTYEDYEEDRILAKDPNYFDDDFPS